MKKRLLMALSLATLMLAGAVAPKATPTYADGSEESSEVLSVESLDESSEETSVESLDESSEESVVESSEESIVESSEESEAVSETTEVTSEEPVQPKEFAFQIKDATIRFRDSADSSYAIGDETIGFYYLSADGWNEGDEDDIVMTVKGNVTTKLESKIVYVYEYRPSEVIWNSEVVPQNADKTYSLKKPEAEGAFDLEIKFTKTPITNPVDLTHINWASLLTVQNLMTIGSWVVIVAGIIILYAINLKYKKRNSTTLEEVKKSVQGQLEETCGVELSKALSDVFDTTIKATFNAINGKLDKVDGNNAVLMRCFLLMQENTPEARLAVAKCLSELDTSEDEAGAKVKALIEAEIKKIKDEQESRIKALEDAQAVNEAWKKEAEADSTSANDSADADDPNGGAVGGGYDGTSI